MGILVGTWKEGTIKVAVPSHWWRAKHFQGLFHSKRPNAPPQCTLFAQFCSGIKHQETSHSKLLIPILGSCCCWMIFKIAFPFLFSLCCFRCCCWGLSACRFYFPLEVVHWPPIHPFQHTWHHFKYIEYLISYLLQRWFLFSFFLAWSFLFSGVPRILLCDCCNRPCWKLTRDCRSSINRKIFVNIKIIWGFWMIYMKPVSRIQVLKPIWMIFENMNMKNTSWLLTGLSNNLSRTKFVTNS